MNPLYNQMNTPSWMKDLESFRQSFKGDAKAQVTQMLQNGQLSQRQFNELAQQANQIAAMLGMKQG